MMRRVTIAVIVLILIVLALLAYLFYVVPSRPIAHAAPAPLTVRWTPGGALATWPAAGATTYTLTRCRADCWLLWVGTERSYLDDEAQQGDRYVLGRFARRGEALDMLGWTAPVTLTGGRVWLAVGGR